MRDAYAPRFGPLLHARVSYDLGEPAPPFDPEAEWTPIDLDSIEMPPMSSYWDDLSAAVLFCELTFAALTEADPRVALATFGAAARVGHEAFLVSAAPFAGFAPVLEELFHHHAPLAPGKVVPMKIQGTPFVAALLAPSDAGSIPLGEADGQQRFALRVIPLTRAEAMLAADSVERLVAALRAAGALETVDPMRDCVLMPKETQRFWAFVRPALIETVQGRMQDRAERADRLVAMNAPAYIIEGAELVALESRLLLKHLEARAVDPESRAERLAARYRKRADVLEGAMDGVQELFEKGVVPGPLLRACVLVTTLTLATHPLAEQLILAAEGEPAKARVDVDRLVPRIVKAIRQHSPDADPEALLAAAQTGLVMAQEHTAAADGFIAPHVAWAYVAAAVLLSLEARSTDEGTATREAIVAGIDIVTVVLTRDDQTAPIERLEVMGRLTVLRMVSTWLEAQGLEVGSPEPDAPPRWPPSNEAPSEPPASEPRKPRDPTTYH